MAKQYLFRGKTIQDIQKMSLDEFAQMCKSRARRKLKRGFTEQEKKLLEKLRTSSKEVRTQCRDLVIIPEMVGKSVKVHNGKEWVRVDVIVEMLGHRLGEFAQTRKSVKHSSPGIGATRSSSSLSVR